ncbi:MAG TPA: hypothetical protein VFZ21_22590 [Gemmatimonadaceae bacterium]|jgi:hypothetical protein|nr:hypothetical protein [Gemmatimonadaceae bacterium]
MGDPRDVRPDEVEIVVGRELRKAGVAISRLWTAARHRVPGGDERAYVVELEGVVVGTDGPQPILVEFRNQPSEVGIDAVRRLASRTALGPPGDGPKRLQPVPDPASPPAPSDGTMRAPPRAMFATSAFDAGAVAEALSLGVRLLRVADGPAAFRRSPWAMGAQPPAWVPEYMAETVDLGPAGDVRYQPLMGAAKRPR